MCCVCDLGARLPPGFVVSGANSCSRPLDQCADVLATPSGYSHTQRPGRLEIATRSNTGPPGGLADRDDCRDGWRGLGGRLADYFGESKESSLGECWTILHGVTSCWVTRTICIETEARLLHFRFFQDVPNPPWRDVELWRKDAGEFTG